MIDAKVLKEVSIDLMESMDLEEFIGLEEQKAVEDFVELVVKLYFQKLLDQADTNIKN